MSLSVNCVALQEGTRKKGTTRFGQYIQGYLQ
jgi:hypothetical protein